MQITLCRLIFKNTVRLFTNPDVDYNALFYLYLQHPKPIIIMKKRIVICCDGTWNFPGDKDHGKDIKTNVQKLFESVCNIDALGTQQIKYYIEGVGTSGSKFRRIMDGATGWGLDQNIISAYKFLVWNYVAGDEIYLFGFSRGAYTARSIAGLIRNSGIIRSDDLTLINQAYDIYRNRNDEQWRPNGPEAKAFKEKNSHEANIKFIGVWDTVGSLGIPLTIFRFYNKSKYKFHDTTLSSYVDYAYHALAINEKRYSFKPTLWTESKFVKERPVAQVMEQRWFLGVHSNVGGGYPETGISDIALNWMVEKARDTSLAFEEGYLEENVNPDFRARIYDSFVFPFNLLPPAKRVIRKYDDSHRENVDQTVIDRWEADDTYRPENLKHIIDQLPPNENHTLD
jgi:uncharacterized protein (DUF2235 family)